MLSCPNGDCTWTISKVRVAGPTCYRCKTDLASVLDPGVYAKFAATRAACTSASGTAGPNSTAADISPTAGNDVQPAAAPATQAKVTATAAATIAAPWRTRSSIEHEKATLQSLHAEADEQRLYTGGVVQEALLAKIFKSEAIIVALDTNSGGLAVDRLGDEANLRRLQDEKVRLQEVLKETTTKMYNAKMAGLTELATAKLDSRRNQHLLTACQARISRRDSKKKAKEDTAPPSGGKSSDEAIAEGLALAAEVAKAKAAIDGNFDTIDKDALLEHFQKI